MLCNLPYARVTKQQDLGHSGWQPVICIFFVKFQIGKFPSIVNRTQSDFVGLVDVYLPNKIRLAGTVGITAGGMEVA